MRRSNLSQYKQNKLIELFVGGVAVRTAAQLLGVKKIPQLIIAIYYAYSSIKTGRI